MSGSVREEGGRWREEKKKKNGLARCLTFNGGSFRRDTLKADTITSIATSREDGGKGCTASIESFIMLPTALAGFDL